MAARFFQLILVIASVGWSVGSCEEFELTEGEHVKRLAPKYGAEMEVRQWDGVRVDMVTDDEVIEVDFGHKWAEAIGQVLYYSIVDNTERTPAILLLIRDREERFGYRAQAVCAKYGIRMYIERIR